jgi:hypothetical protein
MSWFQWVQAIVGIGLVGYAVVAIVRKVAGRVSWPKQTPRAPVDDLRLVIDLAARLRDAGKSQAVTVCQQLLDELLKPEATK